MIANRTLSNAQKLVELIDEGEAYNISELPNLLEEADIVISSTSAPGVIISKEMVTQALKRRDQSSPLFFLLTSHYQEILIQHVVILTKFIFLKLMTLNKLSIKNIDERKTSCTSRNEND